MIIFLIVISPVLWFSLDKPADLLSATLFAIEETFRNSTTCQWRFFCFVVFENVRSYCKGIVLHVIFQGFFCKVFVYHLYGFRCLLMCVSKFILRFVLSFSFNAPVMTFAVRFRKRSENFKPLNFTLYLFELSSLWTFFFCKIMHECGHILRHAFIPFRNWNEKRNWRHFYFKRFKVHVDDTY